MLRELGDGLFVAERDLRFGGIEVGTRMTVMRLGDGGLLVHSPIEPEPALRKALDALGSVRFIVAPNRFHHLFAGPFREAYPESELHAAPGLAERFPALPIDAELRDGPAGWSADVDHLVVRGAPISNEVVFCHRPSRTLVLTDLALHMGPEAPFLTRVALRALRAYDRFGPSLLERIVLRDRAAARESFERFLAWDFDRVVMAHGRVFEGGGREALRRGYAWLLEG